MSFSFALGFSWEPKKALSVIPDPVLASFRLLAQPHIPGNISLF